MNKYQRMDQEKSLAMQYSSRDNEVIEIYKEVINKTAKFCSDLGVQSVSEVFNVFSILAHEGYLSYGKSIALELSRTFDIFPYEGADILIGKGNCRHFSNFLKLLYKARGNESFVVANYLYDIKDSNFTGISRMIQKITRFNHACCLVEENSVAYIYDPLNVEAYVYKDTKYQTGNHGGRLRINFDNTYLLNLMTREQLAKIKTYPSVYLLLPEEKRRTTESKTATIRPTIFGQLNNTDCMDYFHESIKHELTQAKKLAKIQR